jgi:acetaldehyde dehydrogenase (acetylating)
MTTGVMPSMTLGSGGVGGAITGDNITVYHMYNTKRLAYETKPPPEAALLPGSTDDPIQLRSSGAPAPAGAAGLESARIDDIVRRVLEELRK